MNVRVVTIEPVDPQRPPPALGEECRFAARGDIFAAVRYFLEHEGVVYPQPLESEADGSVRLYPEAPGRYALVAAWRAVGGESGWARTEFQVNGPSSPGPQQTRAHGARLWAPTAWDTQLLGGHEPVVMRALERILRPGMTVYDIGANLGSYSAPFIRWIGADGWLYAIEPNPICVHFLRANLARTRARNFSILPIAVARTRCEIDFTINYGSSMIGVGGEVPGTAKPGHHVRVQGESLDALIAALNLRSPDFIKLDVEGAEATAVAGMMGTLEACRPHLMIELHGRSAGSGALRCLARLGYQYVFPFSDATYTADALLAVLPDACVQVIGRP